MTQDNTVGSRSRTNLAYIAGFLDGDGSLMLQLKKRKDGKRKYRFMCTVCLYQDSRHELPLHFIKRVLGIGYISKRNDGISELRINGYAQIHRILTKLKPFIRFKKIQAETLLKASKILMKSQELTRGETLKLVDYITAIQAENYSTRRKRTKNELFKVLDLTP
ncbi:MAG: LAGLIDADG family homing endonuclease [Patescibacteria group bacterium]|nr:LAGLIDADG family homing endonuclease [Patescibacteria group bacterium]